MNLLVQFEVVALSIVLVLLAILRSRGMVTEKKMAFIIATLLSLFVGSAYLSAGHPKTLFAVSLRHWLIAIALSLLSWVYIYLFSRWLSKQWFQK